MATLFSNKGNAQQLKLAQNPFELSPMQPIMGFDSLENGIKNPHKASMLAVFLPGAGQVYNEKFWKVPIVFAGLGVSGYLVYWNRREMKTFQDELDLRINTGGVSNYANLTIDQLKSNRDFYRTNRDYSIISFVAIYALQIVDAAVDAHLSGFKLGDDMTMRMEPKAYKHTNLGLGLTLTF